MSASRSGTAGSRRLFPLTLTAIGVVYGDIGTSPLYTIRECFYGIHGFPPTHENVLGVLSLILYALLIVISIKYIAVVMRADNQGEGGILALTALLPASKNRNAYTTLSTGSCRIRSSPRRCVRRGAKGSTSAPTTSPTSWDGKRSS